MLILNIAQQCLQFEQVTAAVYPIRTKKRINDLASITAYVKMDSTDRGMLFYLYF